jgi:RimJ/RimL family protein N-acetyltransferase
MFAGVAADNAGSIRVLERCGFTVIDEATGFANARGEEIAEYVMQLD